MSRNERFYGYNRSDYYFPRTCREAFGTPFEVTASHSTAATILINATIFLGVLLWLSLSVHS